MANPKTSGSTVYTWQNLDFKLPDGLEDQSVLQFVGESPQYNLVVTKESLAGQALPIFIQARIRELSSLLPSFALKDQKDMKVAGHKCTVVTQDVTTPDGTAVRQVQAYVDIAGEASIFTATTPADDAAWAADAIANVLGSVTVR